jgi:hypothetical protein
MVGIILALSLTLLLLTVESSLQTSIVWDRTTAWTPWLYKIGPFSIADIVIVTVSLYVLFRLLLRPVIIKSSYVGLCLLALVYLCIGLIYNIGVFTLWKTYFYDTKVVLFLTVPYLFLMLSRNHETIIQWFSPKRIFIYCAIASIIDFSVVNIFGKSEYPSFLGYPAIPQIFPFSLIIVGIAFATKLKYRILFIILLAFELVNTVNRLSLGSLFNAGAIILYIMVLSVNVKFKARTALLVLSVLLVNVVAVLLITNPLNMAILAAKGEGATTREVQLENVLLSFNKNIPGVLGKGLGSTWFTYVPISDTDIYSVGTSVGSTSDEAMGSPVQFIFNWTPPSLLYKWGIIGSILLCCFIGIYVQWNTNKIKQLTRLGLSKMEGRYLYALLVISSIYIIENFTYIGQVKQSLITSVLAFCVTHRIQTKFKALSGGVSNVR